MDILKQHTVHYIDAEKLIAKINNKLMSVNLEKLGNFGSHRVWAYNDVKNIIYSLQQEQPKSKLVKVRCVFPFDETWEKNKIYTCEVWHHGDLNRNFWDVYYDYGKDPKYVQFPTIELLNKEFAIIQEVSQVSREQPNNMIQWTGNNLKEVIDFTGKSPRFGEWFKSWGEYENYVHTHNDILKLFCEDGGHYEVPIGAWIVKTPDGHNVPSIAKYVQQEQPEGGCSEKPNDLLSEQEPTCKTCDYYENDCPFTRGKLMVYPNRVCKDYTHSADVGKMEQPEADLEKEIDAYFDKIGMPVFWCNDDELLPAL